MFGHSKDFKRTGFWGPKRKGNKMIHDENNGRTDDELAIVRDFLKMSKYACLYIRNEHTHGYKLLYTLNKNR